MLLTGCAGRGWKLSLGSKKEWNFDVCLQRTGHSRPREACERGQGKEVRDTSGGFDWGKGLLEKRGEVELER